MYFNNISFFIISILIVTVILGVVALYFTTTMQNYDAQEVLGDKTPLEICNQVSEQMTTRCFNTYAILNENPELCENISTQQPIVFYKNYNNIAIWCFFNRLVVLLTS